MNVPQYTIIKYIRDKNKIPQGVLVAIKTGDGYNIGYSLCNKYDRFEKRMALEIAVGRANTNTIAFAQNLPHVVAKNLPDFLIRCAKYYK
jgi:hypothetical protein